MTGRRDDDEDQHITAGEVYRLIVRQVQPKLDSIDHQVRLTNGRTLTLEAEMREVKTTLGEVVVPTLLAPPVPVMTPEGESLSVKVSPKMWLAIAAAGGSALAAGTWVSGLIERLTNKP